MEYFISLDVGGTGIKTCSVSARGERISEITKHPANANASKDEIIKNLADIIMGKAKKTDNLAGIAIAFPGPFDYDRGISKIKGIGKYDAIFGVNIKEEIAMATRLSCPIKFINDADMFALSAYRRLGLEPFNRVMAVCIGTGLGSAFIESGACVKDRSDVPKNGWVFDTPFKDGILDAYISATGLRRMIKEYKAAADDVKDLDALALAGDEKALKIYNEFADMLCDALLPFVLTFKAQCLVVGGQVAKGFELFGDKLKEALHEKNIPLVVTEISDELTLLGAPYLFM